MVQRSAVIEWLLEELVGFAKQGRRSDDAAVLAMGRDGGVVIDRIIVIKSEREIAERG